MQRKDGCAAEAREALRPLGWNLGRVDESAHGITVVCFETPFDQEHPGIRELRLHGASEQDAIARFLNQDIAVRVIARGDDAPPGSNRGIVAIPVAPVTPLPGEEGDEWVIFRRGSAAIPFVIAAGTPRAFQITRSEARLINVDASGRRAPFHY